MIVRWSNSFTWEITRVKQWARRSDRRVVENVASAASVALNLLRDPNSLTWLVRTATPDVVAGGVVTEQKALPLCRLDFRFVAGKSGVLCLPT
jgi:hypothetical protein